MKISKPEPDASTSPTEPSGPASDVALIHGVGSDGSVHVLRKRGDQIEAGALQPVREGVPIHGELVSLRPREACPLLCDVEVHYAPPALPKPSAKPSSRPQGRRKGPAQVATESYRDNWDSIWSAKKDTALN